MVSYFKQMCKWKVHSPLNVLNSTFKDILKILLLKVFSAIFSLNTKTHVKHSLITYNLGAFYVIAVKKSSVPRTSRRLFYFESEGRKESAAARCTQTAWDGAFDSSIAPPARARRSENVKVDSDWAALCCKWYLFLWRRKIHFKKNKFDQYSLGARTRALFWILSSLEIHSLYFFNFYYTFLLYHRVIFEADRSEEHHSPPLDGPFVYTTQFRGNKLTRDDLLSLHGIVLDGDALFGGRTTVGTMSSSGKSLSGALHLATWSAIKQWGARVRWRRKCQLMSCLNSKLKTM